MSRKAALLYIGSQWVIAIAIVAFLAWLSPGPNWPW
jgi:hypothetical protein